VVSARARNITAIIIPPGGGTQVTGRKGCGVERGRAHSAPKIVSLTHRGEWCVAAGLAWRLGELVRAFAGMTSVESTEHATTLCPCGRHAA
jgi:hypothetical protein